MKKIIALGGPKKSGKSGSREGIKGAIKSIPGAPYPYFVTGCPDGEPAGYQEMVAVDPVAARKLKDEYKYSLGGFSKGFVDRIVDSVRGLADGADVQWAAVDLGGVTSPENRRICSAGVTHAVLIVGDDPETGEKWTSRILPWRKFFAELGIPVVAEIHSDYHGKEDVVQGVCPDGIFRGSVHYLERGEKFASRPTLRVLAEHLVRF